MKRGIILLACLLTLLGLMFNIELSYTQTEYWLFIYNYDQYYCGETYPPELIYHYFPEGTEVEITAYAYEHYKFHYWVVSSGGDGWLNFSNPMTIIMDQNYNVLPHWAWDVSIGAFNLNGMTEMHIRFKVLGEHYPDRTPVTFYNLTEVINVTVPEYGFLGWMPTGETNTTITITRGENYTAFYYMARPLYARGKGRPLLCRG